MTSTADGAPARGTTARRAPQISRQTVALGSSMNAKLVSDSWSIGWRSALLREYESHRSVDELRLPPLPDQLIVLGLSGEKNLESFDGSRWRRSRRRPGRLAMTAPGRSTELRWTVRDSTPHRSLHLHVPGDALQVAVREVWGDDGRVDFPDALDASDAVVRQIMLSLRDAHRRSLPDHYAEVALAFLAVHLVSTRSTLPSPPARSMADLDVDRAKQFMVANLAARLTLADIAGSVHLSVFHFSRLFKASTGTTPRQWLMQQRLERARGQLRSTPDGVTTIALANGFNSVSHFSSCFTRAFGVTPSEFRRHRLS